MGCYVWAAEIAVAEKATGGLDDHIVAGDHFGMARVRFETAEAGRVGIVGGHSEIEAEDRLVGIAVEGHSGKVRAHPGIEAVH